MKRWNLLALVLVIFLALALYGSLWDAPPLTWDDDSNIFANPYFTMQHWWGVWTEPYYGLYVPITSSVWACLYSWGAGQAWPFRALNALLHGANIVLVFTLLQGLARYWRLTSPFAVILATAVFALHPVQVETVAWISGGRDLLATFFALLATGIYFARVGRVGFIAALFVFVLALLSKPSVVILPLAILFAEIFVFAKLWRPTLIRLVPWFLLALGSVIVTFAAQVEYFSVGVEWWQRPLLAVDTVRFYVQKMLWPSPLSGNYGRTPELVVADPGNWWKAGVFAVLSVGLFWCLSRFEARVRLVGLWLILILPVSGLVSFGYQNISGVADHYNYLPMVAITILVMVGLDRLWFWRPQPALLLLPIFLLSGWSWASWGRLAVWRSDLNFFTDMAKTAPDSYSTGLGMSVVMCADLKDFAVGVAWTDKALLAKPNDILALANRAYCLLQSGRTDEVIEMSSYLEGLDRDDLAENQPTGYSSFLGSIGSALLEVQSFEEGYQYLCEAYRVKPTEPNHAHNLEVGAQMLTRNGFTPSCSGPDDE